MLKTPHQNFGHTAAGFDRRITRRNMLLAAGALTTTFAVSGMTGAAHAADPVKIGVIFPMTGGGGPIGQAVAKAAAVMVSMLNAEGGVMGRPIELLVRDDESTPAVGATKASELLSQGVSVIFEGYNSPVTLAMQPIIARANVLDFTIAAKADAILGNKTNPYAIRMNSSAPLDGIATANYIANTLKARRIGFVVENDAYGKSVQKGIEDGLQAQGWKYEKVSEQLFPFQQVDFRVALSNIKASNPDAVVLVNANDATGMPALIQQYRQMEISVPTVMTVGQISQAMIDALGPAADGLTGNDIYVFDSPAFASNPIHQRFVAELKKQGSIEPDKYMAMTAAAIQIWAMTANKEKSLDRATLAKAIQGNTVNGTLLGDLTYNEIGQITHKLIPVVVKGGQLRAIK